MALSVSFTDASLVHIWQIQHGRLAMLAFLELLRHDIVNYTTGNDLDHFIIGLPAPY